MLKLRSALVLEVVAPRSEAPAGLRHTRPAPQHPRGPATPGEQSARRGVRGGGRSGRAVRRRAIADVSLVGRAEVGDEVIVNVRRSTSGSARGALTSST